MSNVELGESMKNQKLLCVAVLLSLTFSGCINPQNQEPILVEEIELTTEFTHPWNESEQCLEHEGDQRCWVSYIPSTISEEDGAPLLLDIHGYGSTMHIQKNHTGLTELADNVGAIILYPQGIHRDGDPQMGGGAPSCLLYTSPSPRD